jgi:hypothetical protein
MVVCGLSGTLPSDQCGSQYTEVFASDQPPLPAEQDLLRKAKIDLWTGYEASKECEGPSEEVKVLNVADKWARDWLGTGDGRAWLEDRGLPRNPYFAPERACKKDDPQPVIEFNLKDGDSITSNAVEIKGSAAADGGFKKWVLEYGQGADPASWTVLVESDKPVENGTLYNWNVADFQNGKVSLRLTLVGDKAEVDERITLNIDLPVPTATPTGTSAPTATPTPTETPTPEIVIPPTETPTPTFVPTETPTPTLTAIP